MVIRYRLKTTGKSPFSFYSLYRANAVSDEQAFEAAAGVYREEVRAAGIGGYIHRAITECGETRRLVPL